MKTRSGRQTENNRRVSKHKFKKKHVAKEQIKIKRERISYFTVREHNIYL